MLEILYAPYSVVKGLMITIVHMFRPKVTLQYPDERWTLPEHYRGVPSLPVDPKTGTDKCIGCGACVRMCPELALNVTVEVGEDKKRNVTEFTLDAGRCMFCGLCSEVCPTGALRMSKHYELSAKSRDAMVYDREEMHRLGGALPEEPEAEEKPEASSAEPVSAATTEGASKKQ